jgi:hypothetical protein
MTRRRSPLKKSLPSRMPWGKTYFLLLLLLLPACAPLATATPPPTPQILVIARPLALQGWNEKIHTCAKNYPQLAVFVVEDYPGAQASPKPEVTLQLGNSSQPVENAYLLGQEDILITANTAFPNKELSLAQLQDLLTASLPGPISQGSQPLSVQFWTYPPGDEARAAFEQAVLPAGSSPIQSLIAPDPSAMREALENDPTALGYLPASSFSQASAYQQSKLKIIHLKETPADFLRQPVVASLSSSPSPLLNAYLQCLSSSGY